MVRDWTRVASGVARKAFNGAPPSWYQVQLFVICLSQCRCAPKSKATSFESRAWPTDVGLYLLDTIPQSLKHVLVNEARALRVVELMNDFRTIQLHIASHVSRAQASPPDQQSYYTDGYVVLRQCSTEAQALLASNFDPGSLGLVGGIGESEVQKATLQRWGC